MKTTAAFAPLPAVATGIALALSHSAIAMYVALGLFACVLAIEVSIIALYVRRPGDRKDLLKFYRVWRAR